MPAILPVRSTQYEHSPRAIASFLESIDAKVLSFEGAERRADERYVVAIPSVVQPLDEACRPQGKPFYTATRDISLGGVALIHTQPMTAKFAGIKLMLTNGAAIQLLIQVLRCRPLENYFDIAGRFIVGPA